MFIFNSSTKIEAIHKFSFLSSIAIYSTLKTHLHMKKQPCFHKNRFSFLKLTIFFIFRNFLWKVITFSESTLKIRAMLPWTFFWILRHQQLFNMQIFYMEKRLYMIVWTTNPTNLNDTIWEISYKDLVRKLKMWTFQQPDNFYGPFNFSNIFTFKVS